MIKTKYGYIQKVISKKNLLADIKELEDIINKEVIINIPFSSLDLEDLLNGRCFDWCFEGVNLHIYNEELAIEQDD